MPNTPYDNFFLENEITDQLDSHLALERFCTVDDNLVGRPGMKVTVNVYSITGEAEKLKQGEGNTKKIEAGFVPKDYEIELAQDMFEWYDEEAMKDPTMVSTGMQGIGSVIYNTMQSDIYTEFSKASQEVTAAKPDFAAFVDAVALLNLETPEAQEIFAFISPKDEAKVRKALGEELKYVESFSRRGYVGTVGGVNIYTKKNATEGAIVGGMKTAVKLFRKKRVSVELTTEGNRSSEDANVRKNTAFGRQYYFAALVRDTDAFKITLGA